LSQAEKNVKMLTERQALFKQAALEAKKAGNMEEAKEYLRQFKGFDRLIESARGGRPVDFNTLPVPPQQIRDVQEDYEIVSKEDCRPDEQSGDRLQMYSRLEKDLLEQYKLCKENRAHFKATAEIASANKFQQMMEHTKKDIDTLRYAAKRGDAVPKFHYEVRAYSRVVCNTDLTDNELEFTVHQGINLSGPKDLDSFCKLEFPYPKDDPPKDKTAVVYKSSNPEYNHSYKVPINPKEKSFQRFLKRHSAKVELFQKGGFLRSDTLLGTAKIELAPLEGRCTVHDSFSLMDGRRAVGGKVEVSIRVRDSILTKQIEKTQLKWLVITFS